MTPSSPSYKISPYRRGSGGAGLRTVVALATAAACAPPHDDSDRVYDPTHILDVQIEIAAADWDALRNEQPPAKTSSQDQGPACLPYNNPGFAYTMYRARVAIDGEIL